MIEIMNIPENEVVRDTRKIEAITKALFENIDKNGSYYPHCTYVSYEGHLADNCLGDVFKPTTDELMEVLMAFKAKGYFCYRSVSSHGALSYCVKTFRQEYARSVII